MPNETNANYWESTNQSKAASHLLKDIKAYKDLIREIAITNFKAQHRQTFLGTIWTILKPMLMVLVYVLVFVNFLKVSTNNFPPLAFFLVGNTLWQLFTDLFGSLSNLVNSNTAVWSKVYYPRIVAAIANMLYVFMIYSGQLLIMIVVLIYFYATGSIDLDITKLPWALLSMLLVTLLTFGIGLIMSTLTAEFADFNMITNIVLRVLLFATPVLYTLDKIPADWQWLAWINPLSPCFELFRYALIGGKFPPIAMLLFASCIAILICIRGFRHFTRRTAYLMDYT